jgi:phosphatidylglycerol---prolipoprotein diacylglyceryl transferase
VIEVHESSNAWVYPTLVTISLLLLFLWPTAKSIVDPLDRRKYWGVQTVTLAAAIVGAKLAMLAGDKGWPVVPLADWREYFVSGRSITGGLALGFVGGEIAKPLFRYRLPPNDAFAAKLPFSIALGRVGCLLVGCCRGVPHEGLLSVRYEDGICRWPAQLVEIAFQLGMGVLFLSFVRRRVLEGRVYALYMIVYGAFRFATEFMRETPKPLGSFSVYQAISVVLVMLGVGSMVVRSRTTVAAMGRA